jgi:hypothetical protein
MNEYYNILLSIYIMDAVITEMNHYFMVDMNEYYNILLSIYIMDAYYWDESLFYNRYEWILQYFVIHLYYGCSITEINHYFMMDMNEYYNILLSIYIMDAVLLRWITIL